MQDIRQRLMATFQVEHRDHVEEIRSLLALISKTGSGKEFQSQLDEAFRRAHTLKAGARVVDLLPVEALANRLESLFAKVRSGEMQFSKELAALAANALDEMEDRVTSAGKAPAKGVSSVLRALEGALGIESEHGPPVDTGDGAASGDGFRAIETVRINVQKFDELLRSALELLAECRGEMHIASELKLLADEVGGLQKDTSDASRAARKRCQLLGSLPKLEKGASAAMKQVHSLRRSHQRRSWKLLRLGSQLQNDVLQAMMIPAEGLLEGYRKMMRDLARDEGKQFEFTASSSGEYADRRVLEALKDPLLHILRNAVSHGIETPEERLEKGKAPGGFIHLRIGGDRQRLSIVVEDDGRGIETVKILQTAVRQKLLTEEQAARATKEEAIAILFTPGFSTSETVNNLSGRGMGLSVVAQTVRRLQGQVQLKQREHGGTQFRISVPVSVASQRFLLVSSSGQTFAIPAHFIDRMYRIRRADVETPEGKAVAVFDGERVPLFGLRELIGQGVGDGGDWLSVVCIRTETGKKALAVDSLLWQSEALIQDLGPATPRDGRISGGILLDDGSVALALDPDRLFSHSAAPEAGGTITPAVTARTISILVVDDSITTRTLERSILEANGYRVRIAVDGVDGMQRLREELPDLVISDVEMPRMNGFEFLGEIKKDVTLKKVPVILLTSLERREDLERGRNLGADAYIVKQKFDQGNLLTTIRRIVRAKE